VWTPKGEKVAVPRHTWWWNTARWLMETHGQQYLDQWAKKRNCNEPRYGFIVSKYRRSNMVPMDRGAIVFVGWILNKKNVRVPCVSLYVYHEMFKQICYECEITQVSNGDKMCDSLSKFWQEHLGKPVRQHLMDAAVKNGLFPVVGKDKPLFYKITNAWWEKGMCESAYNDVKRGSRVFAQNTLSPHGFSIKELLGDENVVQFPVQKFRELLTLQQWLVVIYKLDSLDNEENEET
jgi:hypothetical protein